MSVVVELLMWTVTSLLQEIESVINTHDSKTSVSLFFILHWILMASEDIVFSISCGNEFLTL